MEKQRKAKKNKEQKKNILKSWHNIIESDEKNIKPITYGPF